MKSFNTGFWIMMKRLKDGLILYLLFQAAKRSEILKNKIC